MFCPGNAFVCKAAFVVFVVADKAFGRKSFIEGDLKIGFHDFYFLFAAKKVLEDKGYTVEFGKGF